MGRRADGFEFVSRDQRHVASAAPMDDQNLAALFHFVAECRQICALLYSLLPSPIALRTGVLYIISWAAPTKREDISLNTLVLGNLEGVLTSIADALRERGLGEAPDAEAESRR
jgi:hypothetical protein